MLKNINKKEIISIPNILSFIRILLVPIFIALFLCNYEITAFIIFVLAMLTDVIDGFIARKFNMQTELGKLIDPLADKLIKISAIICFTIKNIIPVSILIVFLILDLFLIVSSVIILKQGIVIKSNIFGKLGTFLVFVGIVLSFFYKDVNNANIIILLIGLIIYAISCVSYTIIYFIKRKRQNKLDKEM